MRSNNALLHAVYHTFLSEKQAREPLPVSLDAMASYYNSIIRAMPGNVYWLDTQCRAVGCNDNVLRMFGLTRHEDFYGMSFDAMAKLAGWSRDQHHSFKKDTETVLMTGKSLRNIEEPPIPNEKGRLLYFLTTRKPLFDSQGELIGVVGISTDITDRKEAEIALREANLRAETSVKVKNEFLQNMRHDIMTPLSNMQAIAHLLTEPENTDVHELAQDLQQSAQQLMGMMEDIFKATDQGYEQLVKDRTVFNLKHLLERIIATKKGFQLAHDIDVFCDTQACEHLIFEGSYHAIHRIVLNLFTNAIKFTQEGRVTLTASLKPGAGDDGVMLCIEVKDSGIGISPQDQHIIFEQFKRLTSSASGRYEGSGLGLYIVRTLVNLLGGSLVVKSKESEGSTFTVTVPVLLAHEEKTASCTATSEAARRLRAESRRVLLVEDNIIASKVGRMLLERSGFEVCCAMTGQEGIAHFKAKNFDLVLLDVGLPDISGVHVAEACEQHKKTLGLASTPIVALSAHLSDAEQSNCLASGMHKVLKKPLTVEKIDGLLHDFL